MFFFSLFKDFGEDIQEVSALQKTKENKKTKVKEG